MIIPFVVASSLSVPSLRLCGSCIVSDLPEKKSRLLKWEKLNYGVHLFSLLSSFMSPGPLASDLDTSCDSRIVFLESFLLCFFLLHPFASLRFLFPSLHSYKQKTRYSFLQRVFCFYKLKLFDRLHHL